jgi:hypothetical protein
MKLIINSQEIPLQNVEFYSWYHLIDWLLRNQINARQGIVELSIDGRSFRHILSDLNSERFPQNIDTIEIKTLDAYAIIESGLQKIADLLPTLEHDQEDAINHFRAGNLAQGSAILGRLIKNFIPMFDFIQSLSQNFQVDFTVQLIDRTQTVQDLISQSQTMFVNLNASQERFDSIELADLLEYEMTPILENWKKAIIQLRLILPTTPLRKPS